MGSLAFFIDGKNDPITEALFCKLRSDNARKYIFPNIFLNHSTSSSKIPTHHDPKPTSYTPLQQARTSYTTHRQIGQVVRNDDFFFVYGKNTQLDAFKEYKRYQID